MKKFEKSVAYWVTVVLLGVAGSAAAATLTEDFGGEHVSPNLEVGHAEGELGQFSFALEAGKGVFRYVEATGNGGITLNTKFAVLGNFTATVKMDRSGLGTGQLGLAVNPTVGPGSAPKSGGDIFFARGPVIIANIFFGTPPGVAGGRSSNRSEEQVTFRIRREGNTITADFDAGRGGFEVLHSATNPVLAAPVQIGVFLFTFPNAETDAKVGTFDDFSITADAFSASEACDGDFNSDNQVTIDELITAVGNALKGCDPPVTITGEYRGNGQESTFADCAAPNAITQIDDVVIAISQQTGPSFTGTLAGVRSGSSFIFDIVGTVDASGRITAGTVNSRTDEAPLSGTIGGQVINDHVSVSYVGEGDGCRRQGSCVAIK